MIGLVDVHAHLQSHRFRDDLETVVSRSCQHGVRRIVVVGLHPEDWKRCLEIADQYPELVKVALGVHPHYSSSWSDEIREALFRWASHRHVVAIGETGLDFYRNLAPKDAQREAFCGCLGIARELNLPVIIHVRDAYEAVWAVLQREGLPQAGGVLHCFSGNRDAARMALDMGLCISFAGQLTYGGAQLIDAARYVPSERLLSETDCPYLAPVPFRGRRCEPWMVARVVETLAEVRGEAVEVLTDRIWVTAERLFGHNAASQVEG